MPEVNLLMITGQEGAGKSTTLRALGPATPSSARIDAEDVGETNPWDMNDAFMQLLWKNVADLTRNFWDAGFRTVVAGSFVNTIEDYRRFRAILNRDANVYVVQLCAGKPVRDVRRIERGKPTTEEWRDMVDQADPEDSSLASSADGYRFLRIDNDGFDVGQTVQRIQAWAPELCAPA
jgi:energy-coupling factor transporter ATP-binding protein EcfA2